MSKLEPQTALTEQAPVSKTDHWVKGDDMVTFEPSVERGLVSAPADELQKVWLQSVDAELEKVKLTTQITNRLLNKLASWIDEHSEVISKGVITTRDHELLFIAVQRQNEYCSELEDSLLDLEFEISDDEELKPFSLSTIVLIEKSTQTLQNFLSNFNFVYVGSKAR